MSEATNPSRVVIMEELLDLTKEMLLKEEDEEFLIESVDKRQILMDEYDLVDARDDIPELSPQELQRISGIAQEIIKLDVQISNALERHKAKSKEELTASNSKQRILGYVNQALSASGSYMDFRK